MSPLCPLHRLSTTNPPTKRRWRKLEPSNRSSHSHRNHAFKQAHMTATPVTPMHFIAAILPAQFGRKR